MIMRATQILVSVLFLGACLPTEAPPAPPAPAPGISDLPFERATPEEIADRCGASGVQDLVGRTWPQPLPRNMTQLRVHERGDMLTMDLNTDRVNIELAPGTRRILRIWCG